MEFGFVAVPFFLLLFSIFELGLAFVLDSVLESATIDTGRLVRTGQADAQSFDAVRFKTELCDRMSVFKTECQRRATVDVRVIPQFAAPNVPDPVTEGAFDPTKTAYNGGAPGDLVLVRVWYLQPMVTPALSQMKSIAGQGKVVLTATTAFRNEPWNV